MESCLSVVSNSIIHLVLPPIYYTDLIIMIDFILKAKLISKSEVVFNVKHHMIYLNNTTIMLAKIAVSMFYVAQTVQEISVEQSLENTGCLWRQNH